jgi:hypothetical protein
MAMVSADSAQFRVVDQVGGEEEKEEEGRASGDRRLNYSRV